MDLVAPIEEKLKRLIESYIRIIDHLNDWVGRSISWLTTGLVLLVCLDVFRRYALNATTVAIIELEWHIFALIFLLGAGYSLRHDKHVRVDVFYNRFSAKGKAWVNFLGGLIFLLPFCITLIYTSYSFMLHSFKFNEGSPNPGGLPARYLIKGAIVLGLTLLLLQTTGLILSSLLVILGEREDIFPEKGGKNAHA